LDTNGGAVAVGIKLVAHVVDNPNGIATGLSGHIGCVAVVAVAAENGGVASDIDEKSVGVIDGVDKAHIATAIDEVYSKRWC
jgi:hypothetical protein